MQIYWRNHCSDHGLINYTDFQLDSTVKTELEVFQNVIKTSAVYST